MSIIQVDYDKQFQITRHGTGYLDGDDSVTDYEINGIKIVTDRDFRDFITSIDVKQDVEYLLLYAIYSTGDSFSRAECGMIEFIDLFTVDQINLVKDNIQRIKDHNKTQSKDFYDDTMLWLVTPDEQEYKIYVPWKGFFENLEEVDYKRVKVTDVYPEI